MASRGRQGPGDHRLLALDIKRAFLYGLIEDDIYIEFPDENANKKKGLVGKLVEAMYGTRAAPHVWQKVVEKVMGNLGFKANMVFPQVYYHTERDLRVLVHVDDFLCSGPKHQLRWLTAQLTKEFELKSQILGPDVDEFKEVKFLGRSLRWKDHGIELEGDVKHAKILLDEWNLDCGNAVRTPGASEDKRLETKEHDELIDKVKTKAYRRAAARLNYMALDRIDLGFASKECSRGMANPTIGHVTKLKRVLRYLKGPPRAYLTYSWQNYQGTFSVYSDSDLAGCIRTRKSTSGGVMLLGSHLIAHWSSTQATVALSVAEAELNALVKASAEAIGMMAMTRDCGDIKDAELFTDSSSAKGIIHRKGCGKLKHLEAKQLWVQGVVEKNILKVSKVPRAINVADALTHHWTSPEG